MVQNGESERTYRLVIQYIKSEILDGRLQPGQKLPPERVLAETLGIGRNSVREALRTLDMLGVISSTQGSGNYVSCKFDKSLTEAVSMMFSMQRLGYRQVSELRCAVETQAAALAAERVTPGTIAELQEIVGKMAREPDETVNAELDKELHMAVAKASENPLIVMVLQSLSDTLDLFISELRSEILIREKGSPVLQEVHDQIVESLRHHNAEGARRAMNEHFRIVDETISECLER